MHLSKRLDLHLLDRGASRRGERQRIQRGRGAYANASAQVPNRAPHAAALKLTVSRIILPLILNKYPPQKEEAKTCATNQHVVQEPSFSLFKNHHFP